METDGKRIKGLIDLHIHSAPDIRERKMNDLELMEAAVRLEARAIVIKSHFVSTQDRACLVNQIRKEKYPEFHIVGMSMEDRERIVKRSTFSELTLSYIKKALQKKFKRRKRLKRYEKISDSIYAWWYK